MNRSSLLLVALALFLGLAGCDSPSASESGTADSTATEDRPPADRRTIALAERLIQRTDSAFRAVEPLSGSEKSQLRRYLQPQHIVQARRLGLEPLSDRRSAAALEAPAESSAVRLRTNDFYIVDPSMSYAVPLVVPSTKHLLERIGRQFQRASIEQELPPYRFLLTNVLRTSQDQAALRGNNTNAARGQSTHEYGTTFDIYYNWYHYAAVHDAIARSAVRPRPAPADSVSPRPEDAINEALLREHLYEAYLGFGREYASRLQAVLGRTILGLQQEGQLLATYERRQPVFHITINDEIEAPAGAFQPTAPADTSQDASAAAP